MCPYEFQICVVMLYLYLFKIPNNTYIDYLIIIKLYMVMLYLYLFEIFNKTYIDYLIITKLSILRKYTITIEKQ